MSAILMMVMVAGGILTLPLLLTAIVGMLERRLVWPYDELTETSPEPLRSDSNPYAAPVATPEFLPHNRYSTEKTHSAESFGFTRIAQCRHAKGGIYRLRHDFWLSPDSNLLMMISWGTLGLIPVQGVWLYTRFTDGTTLVTLDSSAGSEYDLTGLTRERLVRPAPLHEQLAGHWNQVMLRDSGAVPYASKNPLSEHHDDRRRRFDQLVGMGYAAYLDVDQCLWRYTFVGAFLFSGLNLARGMRRAVSSDK
jgi:hypothetical protein